MCLVLSDKNSFSYFPPSGGSKLGACWCLLKWNRVASSEECVRGIMTMFCLIAAPRCCCWSMKGAAPPMLALFNWVTERLQNATQKTIMATPPKLQLFIWVFLHVEILCTHLHFSFQRETNVSFQTYYEHS